MEIQEALNLELKKNFDLRLETNKNKQKKQKKKIAPTVKKKQKGTFTILIKIPFSKGICNAKMIWHLDAKVILQIFDSIFIDPGEKH